MKKSHFFSKFRSICLLFVLGSFCLLNNSFAIPESPDYFEHYNQIIKPFYERSFQGAFTSNVDGIQIRYRKFHLQSESLMTQDLADSDSSPVLVILPAQGVVLETYAETLFDLQNSLPFPLKVYGMDHRGQGESDRILPDSQAQYVDQFQDYIADLHQFLTSIVQKENPNGNIIFLGDSMGGAIGALFDQSYPGMVNSMILSAPMFGIQAVQYWQYALVSPFNVCIRQHYAFGQKEYCPKQAEET